MHLSLLIPNQPPKTESNVSQPVLQLFHTQTGTSGASGCFPFRHQADVFGLVMEGREVFLVAGTAAGETLAIAVPVFHKSREADAARRANRLAFNLGITPGMVNWPLYYGGRVQVVEPAWLRERVGEEHRRAAEVSESASQ